MSALIASRPLMAGLPGKRISASRERLRTREPSLIDSHPAVFFSPAVIGLLRDPELQHGISHVRTLAEK